MQKRSANFFGSEPILSGKVTGRLSNVEYNFDLYAFRLGNARAIQDSIKNEIFRIKE